MKDFVRKIMFALGLDLTANQRMDRMTYRIMRAHLREDSNCIDVGCHKGEVLEWILRFAPKGKHMGFEPIPELFERLQREFADTDCTFYDYALADGVGETEFVYVPEAPAYSGLKERDYDGKKVTPKRIPVQIRRLDDLVPPGLKISLLKIDVEGAEWGVLKGAAQMLERDRPLVIFEYGKGASDRYGTTPQMIMELFSGLGMLLYTLPSYLGDETPLTVEQLQREFEHGENYYFVAK